MRVDDVAFNKIRCCACRIPADIDYVFKVSNGLPRIYRCWACGGATNQPTEVIRFADRYTPCNRYTVCPGPGTVSIATTECRILQSRVKAAGQHDKNPLREHQGTAFDVDFLGRMGEYAVHFTTGIPINPAYGNFKGPDLGECYQVRTTDNPHGLLAIQQETPYPDSFYLFVKARMPWYRVCGWITTDEGMKDEYWNRNKDWPMKGWAIPERDLNPMDYLPMPPDYKNKLWYPRHLEDFPRNPDYEQHRNVFRR